MEKNFAPTVLLINYQLILLQAPVPTIYSSAPVNTEYLMMFQGK